MKNLNLLFNKLYYKDIYCKVTNENGITKREIVSTEDQNEVKSTDKLNKMLFSAGFSKTDYIPCPFDDGCSSDNDDCGSCENFCKKGIGMHRFLLKTMYPGLISGIGNPHDASNDESAVKVGFSFDYTSGQPYIPGSTVKGVLRNIFRKHPDAVAEVCNSLFPDEINVINVKELETAIFDDNDIFFDAVIFWHDQYGELVSGDTITPHGDDVTKNPVPVQILRMNPGVKLEFRFKLNDKGIPALNKAELFKALLMVFGMGAKTNVGYGRLAETDNSRPPRIAKPVLYPTGQPRSNSNNHRSGQQGGNRNSHQSSNRNNSRSDDRFIKCPHCGENSFKKDLNGNFRWSCSRCRQKFPDGYNT